MDAKKEAATLTEKIYGIRGSNQANEVQRLLEVNLKRWYEKGLEDGTVSLPKVRTD